ncbi:FAD-dependent monooxygenase [Lutimaribacter sp. EGI FJ00015]|uniref:FAD-dependent monooxygenase n=1 Tax=Lutimaribacter degradans TaxID=2945989 RepID=A0ACC5ZVF1_9RHOB|nr:FAD-dependent monooxygenase [Lutimaribacter sp. EGI FJ00013]MCM2562080.1 FAD-dependent monooxygenase [Lutimaribacter sp. EGI FJ00013]MCO0613233.1 FAD-dependent monooxygenase [Lutimaribacter sp. EGI FJ00015]MCO0636210.1 FAD-dependent monooxygenase [Lutimaribacter sp. EGI FJ00014]
MRPAGRDTLDSLYFDYPHFDAPKRPATEAMSPVAIVGAGPVGMIAALTLAKHGVCCVLLDNKATFNDGSRAICVSRSSFHILDSLGVVKPFLEKSLGWTTGRSFYRGQQILEFAMPDGANEKFRPMYNLQQQYIEQFLWDSVAASDLIETRWQSEVVGLAEEDDFVRLQVTDPSGTYDLPARWVVAADGARSAIRRICGLRLKGENYEGRYVIADIRMRHDYPTIRRALFDPASRPGGTVLIHRQPDDIWRIDYQLADDESADEATREENVRAAVARVLRDIDHDGEWELEWWSVYSANTLLLDDYRKGRVFFAGDSGHIVPIFGVRGLNNGIADGHNIGWKLAAVLNREAGPALLGSYTPERRGATLDVFANATKSTRFMTPPSHGWRIMRDAALSLALTRESAGWLANPRQMTPYTYAESPATAPDDPAFAKGPIAGAMFQDVALDDGFLGDLLGRDFTLLVFGDGPAPEQAGLTVTRLPAKGAVAEIYGAEDGSAYLVRPDLHVAARWRRASEDGVRRALNAVLARQEEVA